MNKHTTDKIRVQAKPKISIPHFAAGYFLDLGPRHGEFTYMTSTPEATIKKLSKTEYKVLSTGEIKKYAVIEDNTKQVQYIKKSMRRLNELIRANFDTVQNAENACFLTLTYKGANMTDTDQLYTDMNKFIKRLKYAFPSHKLDYIAIAEPHESGGWHMHMLVKSDQPKLFIDYKDLTIWQYEKDPETGKDYIDPNTGFRKLYKDPETGENVILGGLWGHGRATSVRLKSDNAGAYYCAYFTNAETKASLHDVAHSQVDPHDDIESPQKSKKYEKGARLRFYPVNFKFYRASRGILRPKPEKMKYSEVPKQLGKPKQVYTHEIKFEESPDTLTPSRLGTLMMAGYAPTSEEIDEATENLRSTKAVLNLIQRQVYKVNQKLRPYQQGTSKKQKAVESDDE
jgi:hypothetical protein